MTAEKFEVLELIGRGSFGNVRKVRRISDNRLCVRKEISYIHMNPKERSQLIDEFRILGSLNHPNIVEYIHHEHVPEDHMVYLYMEYCDGGDLSQIVKSYKKKQEYVSEELVWQIFTQLIMALYRCHYGVNPPAVRNVFQESDAEPSSGNKSSAAAPNPAPNASSVYKYSTNDHSYPNVVNNEMIVIHRDIKPDNVFLLKDNKVKLGDFGLAKLLVSETDFATTYVGTPYYMSPEVLIDKPYSPLSDIWSLGCVMYELCSLHPPFQAKTHLQLQNKIKEGKFPPIPQHYSQKLRLTISACIVVDSNQRPSTHVLLQEISIKIFRKELELNEKQAKLALLEKSLKHKENLLIQEKNRLTQHLDTELHLQKQTIENEVEEIRVQYQNEFQYVVDREVNNRVKLLLQQPQFLQQLIDQLEKGKPVEKKKLYEHVPAATSASVTTSASTITGASGNVVGLNNFGTFSNNANVARTVKKKKYYNEFFEENTASPFLKTFNSDL